MSAKARMTDCLERVERAVGEMYPPGGDPTLTVSREYVKEWLDPSLWKDNPDMVNSFTGRRVFLFGLEATQVEAVTRGGVDRNEYPVAVTALERYAAARDAADDSAFKAWVDERLAWFEDLTDRLGEARSRTARPKPNAVRAGGYIAAVKEPVKLYDYDLLRTQGLFMAAAVIRYHKWE